MREFELSNITVEQVKGIRAEDDLVLMISGDGMEAMKRGHIDCFSWIRASKGAGKKRSVASSNCIEYNSRGCPATKRKWICVGKCEFDNNFCCEYFSGSAILICLYAFKHSHEPAQAERRGEGKQEGMEAAGGDFSLTLISDDYVVASSLSIN